MFMSTFTFVLMILLMTVVLPTFITFHYITKWKQMKSGQSGLDDQGEGRVSVDRSKLEALAATAKKLDDRVQTLEKLLDAEAPGWRNS